MKKLLFIATVLFTVFSFSSCKEDDPVPMIWEFSNYDREAVSTVYSPDYVYQVAIAAPPEYSGDITLKCTNYPQITFNANNADGTFKSTDAGFTVIKVDSNTLKITFEPIPTTGEKEIYEVVSANGKNGKETGITNISIGRVKNEGN